MVDRVVGPGTNAPVVGELSVGEFRLDPNPLGLDSVPGRPLVDPVRLEDPGDGRLDENADDVVDENDGPLVLNGGPMLANEEGPRLGLPMVDDNGVLENVGLDRPKPGTQGVPNGG